MAKFTLEIAIVGDKYSSDIEKAVKSANSIQDEFEFIILDETKQKYFQPLSFDKVDINILFDDLENIKNKLDGFHPHLLLITDGYLYDPIKDLTNLFGDTSPERKLSILTTNYVGTVILPEEKMESYFVYYFARFVLNYLQPELKNHKESKSCVMDLKQKKTDLVNSMRKKALCNDCRRFLIETNQKISPSQFTAVNEIFGKSGELLNNDQAKINLPKVFIGSSTEGLPIARKIQSELQYDATCEIWNQGTFELGDAYLESLEKALDKFDFGIFVFSPDDKINIRGVDKLISRDNVIFELGMFLGKLSRSKAFIIHSKNNKLHILSDLMGISKATYDDAIENLAVAVSPGCDKIRTAIKKYA